LGCGFFADVFRPARFAADEGPFAAALAFFGPARRAFVAVRLLRLGVGLFLDFGLDLRAITNIQVSKTWMAGINPAMKRLRLGINGVWRRQAGRRR
jgi:hypothetical protein